MINNSIKIDINSRKVLISPLIYGSFIEHIGDCIHNGLWACEPAEVPLMENIPILSGMRKDVFEASKSLRPSIVRAFGGCYCDVYHWKDAIGRKSARKTVKNKQWSRFPMNLYKSLGPIIRNQFGTDEFLHFCEFIEAEPYLNINYSTGTIQEAVDWIEYCNGPINSKYGKERFKNGRENPYHVKYWGIANEIFGIQEVGFELSPKKYGKRYLTFAKAMKEKDPNIKLIAVGWNHSFWNQKLLKSIGELWLDYVSIHKYVPLPMDHRRFIGKNHPNTFRKYYSLISSYTTIESCIVNAWKDITTIFGENTHVRIAFDEWGIWYKNQDLIKTNYNVLDGLTAALILMTFQRFSDKCPIANWSMLVNCLGLIQTDLSGIILTPVYHALKMIHDHSYRYYLEKVEINCGTFNSKKYAQIKKTVNTPYIHCNATISESGNDLSLIIINTHFSQDLPVNIEILGSTKKIDHVETYQMYSVSPFDYNTIEMRDKIKIEHENLTKTFSLPFEMIIKAHSIIILDIHSEKGESRTYQ
jgi:alpha-N-arabinofuranosidase